MQMYGILYKIASSPKNKGLKYTLKWKENKGHPVIWVKRCKLPISIIHIYMFYLIWVTPETAVPEDTPAPLPQGFSKLGFSSSQGRSSEWKAPGIR